MRLSNSLSNMACKLSYNLLNESMNAFSQKSSIISANTRKILVIRALPGLGDMLCATPALRSLRAALPNAQIDLLGLPDMRWFSDRYNSLIDRWVDFPGFPGIPEGWNGVSHLPDFLLYMQMRDYDWAIQLHGSGQYINQLAVLLGAKRTAGFYIPTEFCPDMRYFLRYPAAGSEIARLLELTAFLDVPAQGDMLTFPIEEREELAVERLLQQLDLAFQRFVCIHAGASTTTRQWTIEGFAQVGDALYERGYSIVLTGTRSEASLVAAVENAMRSPAVNLTDKTSLGTLAALLKQSALLVCNDTGVSHLAAAMRVPSVVVFSGSELSRWTPLDRSLHRPVESRTEGDTTRDGIAKDSIAKDDIVQKVLQEAESLLSKEVVYAR